MKLGPDGKYADEAARWDRAVAGGQAAINRYFVGYLRRVRAAEERTRWAEADERAQYLRDRNAARMRWTRHPEEARPKTLRSWPRKKPNARRPELELNSSDGGLSARIEPYARPSGRG
jgi:hypothetical protein